MLVAGRCMSATHQALGALRVMGPCMAMGQAAGTAAALAVKEGVLVRRVNSDTLRRVLREQGAVLEESDSPGHLENPPDYEVFDGTNEL